MDSRKDHKRIRAIHTIQSTFNVDDETLAALIDQIETADMRDRVERFLKGYKSEDVFEALFSQLERVDLVHGLAQEQSPMESKQTLQVPDFMVLYSARATKGRLLIEVKTADKARLKLMSKQVDASRRYADRLDAPLLYAVYWSRFSVWTLLASDIFEEKGAERRISFSDAFCNHLGIILSDYMVQVPMFFRRTEFDRQLTQADAAMHGVHGGVVHDAVSRDGKTYIKVNPIEASVIDAVIPMIEVSVSEVPPIRIVVERSQPFWGMTLTSIVPRHLAIIDGLELNETNVRASMLMLEDILRKVGGSVSVSLPRNRTGITDHLMERVLQGSDDLETYRSMSQPMR